MLLWIILFTILGSVFSMVGGVFLLWRENFTRKISLFLISFAAGVLLGVGFLDLIPEAFEGLGDLSKVTFSALAAISVLFVIERFLWWYHHHRFEAEEHSKEHVGHKVNKAHAYLLLTGDSIHNFVDGVVIAAAFLADFSLGVGVAVGVIAHEVPQEIADFGVMISSGFDKMKTLLLNFATALSSLLGAIIAYFALQQVEAVIPYILAVAAGVFIYISLSDLIPAIHHRSEHKYDILHFLLFTGGIALIFLM
ncbi:MAG: ZIP family metal transporter [Candidatus Spechtbacterales bacterium]|nr:ZIP family metal transporter [Candidatus Spechtbacterales bacterium]